MTESDKNKELLKKYFKKYFIPPFLILFIPFLLLLIKEIFDKGEVWSLLLNGVFSIVSISLVIGLLIMKLWFYNKNDK